eukprot:CAMPEP_0114557060 /NCGR_PEP_ID=MMETSP0114-20121206/9622_1 /TAXON_ID=31324 /ORGANISM="Goniomonas sp, Strain m" /LENGTH=333 /DNA_ID=CAMNT_0001742309 /DNA_START=69 /DNA_END=1067 /DNA_ORIENTATION=+
MPPPLMPPLEPLVDKQSVTLKNPYTGTVVSIPPGIATPAYVAQCFGAPTAPLSFCVKENEDVYYPLASNQWAKNPRVFHGFGGPVFASLPVNFGLVVPSNLPASVTALQSDSPASARTERRHTASLSDLSPSRSSSPRSVKRKASDETDASDSGSATSSERGPRASPRESGVSKGSQRQSPRPRASPKPSRHSPRPSPSRRSPKEGTPLPSDPAPEPSRPKSPVSETSQMTSPGWSRSPSPMDSAPAGHYQTPAARRISQQNSLLQFSSPRQTQSDGWLYTTFDMPDLNAHFNGKHWRETEHSLDDPDGCFHSGKLARTAEHFAVLRAQMLKT